MSLYSRIAGTQLGSSALFGGALFAAFASDGLVAAAGAASAGALSWFAMVPLMRRLASGGAA